MNQQARAELKELRLIRFKSFREETLGLSDTVRSIPITDPVVNYSIGMVVPQRDPMTPLIAALVHIAREVAPTLES